MLNVFNATDSNLFIERIKKLTPASKPLWGKMNVAQMLAHCNVTYELIYEGIHKKPRAIKAFLLKSFVKNIVVSEKPYKQNSPTASEFKIADSKDFEKEKDRLVAYLSKTQQLGANYFDGKKSHSFGKLTIPEWNNMMSKHLEHHLIQFGV